jgi:octaprenyl-diphosphate synthase
MTATIHKIGGNRAPSLEPMFKLVAPGMNKVNAVILDRMQSEIPLIPEPVSYTHLRAHETEW